MAIQCDFGMNMVACFFKVRLGQQENSVDSEGCLRSSKNKANEGLLCWLIFDRQHECNVTRKNKDFHPYEQRGAVIADCATAAAYPSTLCQSCVSNVSSSYTQKQKVIDLPILFSSAL